VIPIQCNYGYSIAATILALMLHHVRQDEHPEEAL